MTTNTVVYAGLERNALFVRDQKIPFQWIQPGNTGNTGGGSSKPHGTCTWTPGPTGTVISVDPKPGWDNFDFYCILPYPTTPPTRLHATSGDWSAVSPDDWAKSQQMEGPVVEYIGGGFKYTCAWAINPIDGLKYWAGPKKWQSMPADAQIKSMGLPTFWSAEWSLDIRRRVFRYEWVVVNGLYIPVGIEAQAVSVDWQHKELSVSVQLDGNKAGDAYSGLLNNLMIEVG